MHPRVASYLRHAANLMSEGLYTKAQQIEKLAQEAAVAHDDPEDLLAVARQRGQRASQQAQHHEAIDAYREALSYASRLQLQARDLYDLHRALGGALAQAGDDEEAIKSLNQAIAIGESISPQFYPAAVAHIAIADCLRRTGRRSDAEQHLRQAIHLAEVAQPKEGPKIIEVAEDKLKGLDEHAMALPVDQDQQRTVAPPPDRSQLVFDEQAYAAVLADLNELIGLTEVKAEITRLAELLRIGRMRRDAGLKTVDVSLHAIFQGPPGTGKTTVARLFGRLYHSLGLLATDKVVEVTRADLVSGYVGQTAKQVNKVVDSALDGILFVDEAYSLIKSDSPGDFGPEAVAELLKRMEDDRGRLAVIAAGYPLEMKQFLESNSGFASRFGSTVHFADYGPAELVAIFESFGERADYVLDEQAREVLRDTMDRLYSNRDRFFANARSARNLFEDVIGHQAERLLAAGGTPDRQQLMLLTADDIHAAVALESKPPTAESAPDRPQPVSAAA